MIKAVLVDLDDTLIHNDFNVLLPVYMHLLSQQVAHIAPPALFMKQLMIAVEHLIETGSPTSTLEEDLVADFSAHIGASSQELQALFDDFYANHFPTLHEYIQPRSITPPLLNWLHEQGYAIVVATNPIMPAIAIHQRMVWGRISPDRFPFALITTLENMHYAKPCPEYFEEIIAYLTINPDEAIMVGDNWDDDIVGAASAGLHTYWITENSDAARNGCLGVDGHGTFNEFTALVQSGWLKTLRPRPVGRKALLRRLSALPAAIDTLLRRYPRTIIEQCPGREEWSVRDVICHLREHEIEEDRPHLQKIIDQDNPFISMTYDPWTHAHEYTLVPSRQAFHDFARYRAETVDWLERLPTHMWERPARHSVFGPTTFQEMVKFMTDHDRTHLRQMHNAIEFALEHCDESADD